MDPIIISPETLPQRRYILTCASCQDVDDTSDDIPTLRGYARAHVERTGHTMTITERAPATIPDCHAITGG